jgi:hypothetical protein
LKIVVTDIMPSVALARRRGVSEGDVPPLISWNFFFLNESRNEAICCIIFTFYFVIFLYFPSMDFVKVTGTQWRRFLFDIGGGVMLVTNS